MKISKVVSDFCNRYKLCKGCPLLPCVAPVGTYLFDAWLKAKCEEVEKYVKEEGTK